MVIYSFFLITIFTNKKMKRIFLTSIFCKNIITIFLLTASVLYSQTTITKVIDPGGKGDFTSLQSWASWVSSSTSGNLVTANVIEVARCICTNGQPDTEPLNSCVLTITTDASHYLKFMQILIIMVLIIGIRENIRLLRIVFTGWKYPRN